MGALREAAFRFGQGLGLAACAFSQQRPADAATVLRKAMDPGNFLAGNHLIDIRADGITSLDQCERAYETIGGELQRADPVLHDFYLLGLHLGIAQGNTLCAPQEWGPGGSRSFVTALQQALDDMRSPNLATLLADQFREVDGLQRLGSGPQAAASGPTEAVVNEIAMVINRAA